MFDKRAFFKFHRNGLLLVLAVYLVGIFPVFSLTDSLPNHIFVANQHDGRFQREQYVTFKQLMPGEARPKPLIKQIKGVAGDELVIKEGQCFVNGALIGPLQLQTLAGIELHPAKTQVIPEGKVFVAGIHPRSFDSRYQAMGLIDVREASVVYAIF